MTCKDCIHYDVCSELCTGIDMDLFMKDDNTTASESCPDFKGKSRIVELPCKVGDEFYCISRYYSNGEYGDYIISERQVSSFEYDENGLAIFDYTGLDFTMENIYFTREEAEKALEEMEKK